MIPWTGAQQWASLQVFASGFVENKTVLDVGCGSGCGTHQFALKGAQLVVGGDISGEAIEYANTRYHDDRAYFILLDAQELPFPDNSFDTIIAFEVIEHLKRYEHFLSECNRVLRDGGKFISSTPNKAVVCF